MSVKHSRIQADTKVSKRLNRTRAFTLVSMISSVGFEYIGASDLAVIEFGVVHSIIVAYKYLCLVNRAYIHVHTYTQTEVSKH